MQTVTAYQASLIGSVSKLRAKAFAFKMEIGAEFAVDVGGGWRASRFAGLASACWALSEQVRDMPGSWDIYQRAKELGAALAAQA